MEREVGSRARQGARGQAAYLGTVFSHGVVVEASLGLELFPAVLAFQCFLQL